jgi:hypothetical protein
MGDGMGRDTYILKHNGGLCHERDLNHALSSMYHSPPRYVNPAPQKEATAIKYCSDGSGRDTYILYNSGGNHAQSGVSNPVEKSFVNSLRGDSFKKRVLPSRKIMFKKKDFHYF